MIYILCPHGNATGGTELLHQLGHALNMLGFEAQMYYYASRTDMPAKHPYFARYKVDEARDIQDKPENIVVFPEELAGLYKQTIGAVKNAKRILWWLSVDNARANENILNTLRNDSTLLHFYQSEYARLFLKDELGIPEERMWYLSDYLGQNYLVSRERPREDVVLFNPRKGYERTTLLIVSSDARIRWRAINGLAPNEVPDVLSSAKVYIDFGNHPGKDRFPREAVTQGCRLVTGRRGSANNDIDIPLDDSLKISDSDDEDTILEKVYYLLEHYNETEGMYRDYNRTIHEEFHTFETDVLKLFSMLGNIDVYSEKPDDESLMNEILDCIENELYQPAFEKIVKYRLFGYEENEIFLTLEAYMRAGINEPYAVMYICNRILENNPESYEAYLLKAEAEIKAKDLFDAKALALNDIKKALEYSMGTEDEEYVATKSADIMGLLEG